MEATKHWPLWKWTLLVTFLVEVKVDVIHGQYEDENKLEAAKIFKCCKGKKSMHQNCSKTERLNLIF